MYSDAHYLEERSPSAARSSTLRRTSLARIAWALSLLALAPAPSAYACRVDPILRQELDAAVIVVTGVVRVLDKNEQRDDRKASTAGHIRLDKARIEKRSAHVRFPIRFPFAYYEEEGCLLGYAALEGHEARAYLKFSDTRPKELELIHLEYLDL